MSPYEILFGRPRPLANLPFEPPSECEDAQNFFKRMEEVDKKVAQVLNDKHWETARRINVDRKPFRVFVVGSKAWYLRPENSGEKLDSRWLGPVEVVKRVGNNTYEVRVKPELVIQAHATQLKPWIEDKVSGACVPLFTHRRTVPDPGAQPDEWEVDKVVAHRVDKYGKMFFKVVWKGFSETEATWEPIDNFFHRYSSEVVKYCKVRKLRPEVFKFLRDTPTEE